MPQRSEEEITEIRQIALQSIAEVDRGLQIAAMQIRGGSFMAAKQTIEDTRQMLKMHEGTVQEVIKLGKS